MRHRSAPVAFLAAVLLMAGGSAALAATTQDGVRDAFNGYRAALLGKSGDGAGERVSVATLAVYERVRVAALRATTDDLGRLRLVEELLVRRLRQSLEPDDLRALDGAGLVAAAAAHGGVAPGVARIALGPVEVYGDHAIAEQLAADGTSGGLWWRFVREDGRWRLDLTPNFDAADTLLHGRLRASGLTRGDFLERMVQDGR